MIYNKLLVTLILIQEGLEKIHVVVNYRSGTVNSNMVNSKFHLIRSYCEIFVYNCPNISSLKCTVNSNFHLIQSKTLPMNDFKLTVPDLYFQFISISIYTKTSELDYTFLFL